MDRSMVDGWWMIGAINEPMVDEWMGEWIDEWMDK